MAAGGRAVGGRASSSAGAVSGALAWTGTSEGGRPGAPSTRGGACMPGPTLSAGTARGGLGLGLGGMAGQRAGEGGSIEGGSWVRKGGGRSGGRKRAGGDNSGGGGSGSGGGWSVGHGGSGGRSG